ncbi:hypothetical protein AVEN_134237-1 [Araneus ventricosus]|uniref:Uncharacterized protein n=1 Tax=Araneus ventricosus TaxID=182803 RepID=A0A4Y2IQX6_ARAVE|nr:hypothetical protein AVEN_134237-1 [Araneus ventricosus]
MSSLDVEEFEQSLSLSLSLSVVEQPAIFSSYRSLAGYHPKRFFFEESQTDFRQSFINSRINSLLIEIKFELKDYDDKQIHIRNLAKEGTTRPQAFVEPLPYLELYSRRKVIVNIYWRHPPAHSWYRCEGPGAAIRFKGVRNHQTALTRLSSGHLKTLRFSRGDKKFNICTKCNMIEATPQHLLDSVALVYDDLLKLPDFVLEVMRANELMDLI